MKNENNEKKQERNKALTKTKNEKHDKQHRVSSFFKKVIQNINKKWLVKSTTTLLLVLIILIIYFGVAILLDNVVLPEIDCTAEKLYSLSEETKNIMKNIEKDVTIQLLNYGENDTMKNMMEQYHIANKHIRIDRIDDLTDRSDITQKYSIEDSDQLLIVSCGENEIVLNSYELYTYDYSTYEQIDLTEEMVTNAIVNVTTDQKPTIYFMENHAMYSFNNYYATTTKVLEGDANIVESINLLSTGGVPEDCDTLVITTLKEDLTELEKEYIETYINRGGNLLLMCGPNFLNDSLNNFHHILEQYGLTIKDGVVIEGNSNNKVMQFNDIIIENMSSNSVTKNKDLNLTLYIADAAAITLAEQDKLDELGVTHEVLLSTTDSSFIRTNLNLTSQYRTSMDSEEASYVLGVLATKEISENTVSKLIFYSNPMFTEIPTQQGWLDGGNVRDVTANSIAYLNQKENTITIRKNFDSVSYTVTVAQHTVIMIIIFGVPVLVIILGIIIWQIRKRRRK